MSPTLPQHRADSQQPRLPNGRFVKLVCVNAHDRCYGGAGGPCPYCEPAKRRGK